MSYKHIDMWTVVCDEPGCGEVFRDEDEGFIAWMDKSGAEERAEGCEWYCREGKHYCAEHGPAGRFLIDDIAEDRYWPTLGGAAQSGQVAAWTPPGYRDHHQRGETYWCECSGRCTQGATCDCCELADLRAELADRDRRIAAALNLHSQCCKLEPPCMEAAILLGQYTLRGES